MADDRSPEEFDGRHPHEILTLFGMAFYQANVFEVAVTNLLVILQVAKE